MSHSLHQTASSSDSAAEIRADRQADYVAFLHRVPFAIDAANMGYLTGYREDCSYQQGQYRDLDLPVGMLDNDFRNPDLDRFVDSERTSPVLASSVMPTPSTRPMCTFVLHATFRQAIPKQSL